MMFTLVWSLWKPISHTHFNTFIDFADPNTIYKLKLMHVSSPFGWFNSSCRFCYDCLFGHDACRLMLCFDYCC